MREDGLIIPFVVITQTDRASGTSKYSCQWMSVDIEPDSQEISCFLGSRSFSLSLSALESKPRELFPDGPLHRQTFLYLVCPLLSCSVVMQPKTFYSLVPLKVSWSTWSRFLRKRSSDSVLKLAEPACTLELVPLHVHALMHISSSALDLPLLFSALSHFCSLVAIISCQLSALQSVGHCSGGVL